MLKTLAISISIAIVLSACAPRARWEPEIHAFPSYVYIEQEDGTFLVLVKNKNDKESLEMAKGKIGEGPYALDYLGEAYRLDPMVKRPLAVRKGQKH